MRRKIAALLCAIMCITAFTGCSKAELGYLKMSVDMMSALKISETTGKTNIQVDFDAMKGMVTELAKTAGLTDEEVNRSVADLAAFTGKKEVVLDYTLKLNMEDISYNMGLKIAYEGKNYDMGNMYFSMTDGMYVSGTTLWGAYQLSKDVLKTSADSYMFSEEYAKELKASFDKAGYLCVYSVESTLGMTAAEAGMAIPEGGFGDLYAAVLEFYQSAFADYTTNTVTEVSGGYKVQADGQAVGKLAVSFLEYLGNNPEGVLAATSKYMMETMKATGATQADMDAMKAEMDTMATDTAAFKASVASVKTVVEQAIAMPVVSKALDSFKYEATMTKEGAAYVSKQVIDITNAGTSVVKITSNDKTAAGTGAVTKPATSVAMEAFAVEMTTLADKYNPVTGVTVLWGFEGDNSAMMSKERAEAPFMANDTAVTDFVVKEGRVYLPLREVCEAMGETVEWNKDEKAAYIVRGTEKTALAGVVEAGKSYVMLRDFEKLGYTVGYETVDGVKEATLAKAQ